VPLPVGQGSQRLLLSAGHRVTPWKAKGRVIVSFTHLSQDVGVDGLVGKAHSGGSHACLISACYSWVLDSDSK